MHGGNLYQIAKQFGINQKDIIDFSANINPLGIPPELKTQILSGLDELIHYPDPECSVLKEDLSGYLNVPKCTILPGNGASEVLYLWLNALRPRNVLLAAPCFSEYARAAALYGANVHYIILEEQDGFKLHVDKLLKAMDEQAGGEADALVLCNPNNPTAALLSHDALKAIIEHAQRRNIKVLIDEAFIELTIGGNSNSIVKWVSRYDNLFVMRALTKILAIPGLRLGYLVGHAAVLHRMKQYQIPWSVNALAQKAGRVIKEADGFLNATQQWLSTEKSRLFDALTEISGFKVFSPQTNFILIKIIKEGMNAESLQHKMLQHGILIRNAGNFYSLTDRFIRVAVKDQVSNNLLVQAFQRIAG